MPSSPNKRTEVVGTLPKKYKIRIDFLSQKPGPKAQVLKEEEIDWLTGFVDRGDISYINPWPQRSDHFYTGIIDDVKQYVQKRYLRWNLCDLFHILNGSNTLESNERSFQLEFGYEISFSRFYEFLRSQKQYIFSKKIP